MRSVLLYLLLVGVPVLAVSEVLRAGRRLRPPVFVEGTWNLEHASSTSADPSCGDALINADPTVLTISQSGRHLLLTLNDANRTTFAGQIRGETITATTARLASQSSPDDRGWTGASIEMRATVERGGDSDRILGALTGYPCPTYPVTSFIAKRRAAWPPQGP